MNARQTDLLVLRGARQWLGTHNWIKGQTDDGNGNVCMRGALMRSAHNLRMSDPCYRNLHTAEIAQRAENLLLESIRRHRPELCAASVPSFNDAYDTTRDDVLHAFDRAIEDAEHQGGETHPYVLARMIEEANSPVVQVLTMDATVEAMEIGKEGEPYTAEPAEEIPGVERERVDEPTPEPVEPEKVPA